MRQCPCSMHAQCTEDATAVERSAQPMHSPGPGPDTVSGDVGRQIASGSGNVHFCQSLGFGQRDIELVLVYESA